ncbi:hypothetical protein ANN_05083 [Periplaneta americana]|uniref:Reverse transcriptase domain-containing protein n=1 Tax=Periplaneta americana TaxID=6978 RepID=A0ABQ8TCL9_PERAM|nr:hypothetical protein ANN_05083 [Periplaneta americana]
MSPGSSAESYPAFALNGLRENPAKASTRTMRNSVSLVLTTSIRLRGELRVRLGVESIVTGFEKHESTMSTLYDLSKAFDCVSHETICSELHFYGVRGKELDLIRSYLNNCTQITCINGEFSNDVNVNIGVPQGSVGPDRDSSSGENKIDDSCATTKTIPEKVNNDNLENVTKKEEMILKDMLLELSDSCEQYGMKINANKTKTMVIGRKVKKVNLRILNAAVEQVDSSKYLGCTISSNMSCCQEDESRIAMAKEAFGASSADLWRNN